MLIIFIKFFLLFYIFLIIVVCSHWSSELPVCQLLSTHWPTPKVTVSPTPFSIQQRWFHTQPTYFLFNVHFLCERRRSPLGFISPLVVEENLCGKGQEDTGILHARLPANSVKYTAEKKSIQPCVKKFPLRRSLRVTIRRPYRHLG